MTLKIGTVTIGETPRTDVLAEIRSLITTGVEIIEKGVLDGLSDHEIAGLSPTKNDEVLVTRLRDGTELKLGRAGILPKMQERISELDREDGVDLVVLLCSGEFPAFDCAKPLITPYRLFQGVLASISIGGRLGMMLPSPQQVGPVTTALAESGHEIVAVAASPYGEKEGIVRAAEALREEVDVVFMNCFGYDLDMRALVRGITGKPIILPRSLLARTVDDLLSDTVTQTSRKD